MAEPESKDPPTSLDLANERTDLAYDRTKLAHERTLMAWVRTAASLISFGFTIYKFFDGLRAEGMKVKEGSQEFALAMICTGLLSLLLAIIQHFMNLRALKQRKVPRTSFLALTMTFVVAALGIFGLIVVAFRK